MGTEKPPSSHLGGFSCVVMLISFAKDIITQVPNEMQVMRYCRLGAVFFMPSIPPRGSGARGELDELNGYIKTLENIKDRMMKVDSFEVKGSAGLSPEAYSVYRQIVEMLENTGIKQKDDKQTKVARMNALLFAHHADIFAKAMHTQKGNENYTAIDYFKDRLDLQYGGKDMRSNDVLHQAAMRRSDVVKNS